MGKAARKKKANRQMLINTYPYGIANTWSFVAKTMASLEVPAFLQKGLKDALLIDYEAITDFTTVKNPYAINPWTDFPCLDPMYPRMFFYTHDEQLGTLFGLRHWGMYVVRTSEFDTPERKELWERFKTLDEAFLPEQIETLLEIFVVLEVEDHERKTIRVQGDTFAWRVLLDTEGKLLTYMECPGRKVVEEKGNDPEFMKHFRFACTQYLATLWPALSALSNSHYALFAVDNTGTLSIPTVYKPMEPYCLKAKEERQ